VQQKLTAPSRVSPWPCLPPWPHLRCMLSSVSWPLPRVRRRSRPSRPGSTASGRRWPQAPPNFILTVSAQPAFYTLPATTWVA
jgi:hypothetical protein